MAMAWRKRGRKLEFGCKKAIVGKEKKKKLRVENEIDARSIYTR